MSFIKINRQREFMERSNSPRLVLRKEKRRNGIVNCYLSKTVRGDDTFITIELNPEHNKIRLKTTNSPEGHKMSRGCFSLTKVFEYIFHENLHEDRIIIELEKKKMGGGMEITKNRETRFVTLASDFNNIKEIYSDDELNRLLEAVKNCPTIIVLGCANKGKETPLMASCLRTTPERISVEELNEIKAISSKQK